MPICPYLLAAVLSNPETFGPEARCKPASQCLESSCQMWTGKFIDGEGMICDCGLKGEPRV